MHAHELLPCLASAGADPPEGGGALRVPLPAIDDPEGLRVHRDLPPVVDAHLHVFPEPLFHAIWRWFDRWGWPVRYRLHAEKVLDFVESRGVARGVLLHYAHKPGIARDLNAFVAELVRRRPRFVGVATVYPGEEDAVSIVEEGFALGLAGVKLHCHVVGIAPDDPRLDAIYATCAAHGRPLVLHAGREPRSPGYAVDPWTICDADRVARILADHPGLRLVVPHLGADEYDAYAALLERHDNLWLDTTMAVADYLPVPPPPRRLLELRPDRVLYGTDFPNLPYAWDRELRRLSGGLVPDEQLSGLLGANAAELWGLGDLEAWCPK